MLGNAFIEAHLYLWKHLFVVYLYWLKRYCFFRNVTHNTWSNTF